MRKRKSVLAIRLLLLVTAVVIMTTGIANATPTATRALPAEVPADSSFSVAIEVSDYGTVVETLPEEFSYMGSSLDQKYVNFDGPTNTIEFKATKDEYLDFTYYVALRYYDLDEGTYTFSGILKYKIGDKTGENEIGGDTEIVLGEPEGDEDAEPTATRALPEGPVAAGESFSIEIEASYYGSHGYIVETLPDGFEFNEDYSGPVEVEGDTVEFELCGQPSFTYTVTAPDEVDTYTFEGILIDEATNEYDISGDTEIVVGEEGGKVTLPTNITAWKPIEAVVNNAVGESRTFNASINQLADISWQINGTEVQTNESVTDAAYTNTSAAIGTWNVSAIATNTTIGLSGIHTWIWRVTSTPAANMTSTPTPTSAVAAAPSPLLTPTPKSKLSPRPTSSATPTPTKSAKPAVPGFEPVFALATIFAVAYPLLFRKKGDEGR